MIKAWRSKYICQAHNALLNASDHAHTFRGKAIYNYAKILSITQSSGTRKSRAVDATAMKCIVIPLCLREDLGADSFGGRRTLNYMWVSSLTYETLAYPPSDGAVRNLFLGAPSTLMEIDCENYLRSFLRSLIDSVRYQAEKLFKNFGTKRHICLWWNSSTPFLRTRRRETISTRRLVRTGLPERWLLGGRRLSFIPACQGQPDEGLLRLATQENLPIIISMDEVHVLFIVRPQDT